MISKMNTKEKYLTLWYESDKSQKDTSIISRHSSARQQDSVRGVCYYKLYPICEKDADMLLFHTIWDLVTHPDFYDFYEDADFINPHIGFDDVTWFRPYLFFPADEPCINYTEKELLFPYIIGAFSEYDDIYAGEAGLIEDGDYYPMFRNYFVPEWNLENGELDIIYRVYDRGREQEMPKVYDNSKELKKVISELLQYLILVTADVRTWRERLQMAQEMLRTHANELHILHNAGLYDIHTLWALLINKGYGDEKLRELSRRMERELHRYAMMAVNILDWQKGGIPSPNILNEEEMARLTAPPVAPRQTSPLPSSTPAPQSEPERIPYHEYGRYDDVQMPPSTSDNSGYKWDEVYPRYPGSSEDLTEPSYVRKLLPDNWENNIGAMEKAFQWTDYERKILDDAYRKGTGSTAFGDDLGAYVEVLRNLVCLRLRKLAKEEYEANRREWLYQNSR